MIKGYAKNGMTKLALGTHLGDFSEEDSRKYINAISFALQNGLMTIDGAINYRGMCSEKDEGLAIQALIKDGVIKREDFCITSKAGLLFGDVREGKNPNKYLEEVLIPLGVTKEDFVEYKGLYQTLNPIFFEHALQKSLSNLGLETLDVHYIHIPEIQLLKLSRAQFYDEIETLFTWYEKKITEGKIRNYGISFEFMIEEPNEDRLHIELEELVDRANKVAIGKSHFKYVLFEYSLLCPHAGTTSRQNVRNCEVSFIEACKRLGLETVGSMPFAMGEGFEMYSHEKLLRFALAALDHVIVGSKNVEHIKENLAVL